MAKTHSSYRPKTRHALTALALRDAAAIARRSLPRPNAAQAVTFVSDPSTPLEWSDLELADLLPTSDGRRWSPEPFDAVRSIFGTRERVVAPRVRRSVRGAVSQLIAPSFSTYVLEVGKPSRVGFCIRRKRRREVLAAKGRFGGGQMKKKRMRWHSSIHC
jgi:hypothetical protein